MGLYYYITILPGYHAAVYEWSNNYNRYDNKNTRR